MTATRPRLALCLTVLAAALAGAAAGAPPPAAAPRLVVFEDFNRFT